MIEKLSKLVTWPLVALVAVGVAASVAILVFAPPDAQRLLLGTDGLICTLVAYYLRSPKQRAIAVQVAEISESLSSPPLDTVPSRPASMRPPRAPRQDGHVHPTLIGAVCLAAIVLSVMFAWLLQGCGASDAVRASYAVEVANCMAQERRIIDREGTTAEQDAEDWEIERARCNAALEAIEGGQ